MNELSQIYKVLCCPKCERRLNKPYELKCKDLICRDCLETIFRNHRENVSCPKCNKPFDDYRIENYSMIPVNHQISRLLNAFPDVNQCRTCEQFVVIKPCPTCSLDQCDSCYDKHLETHNPTVVESQNRVELSKEEMEILQSIKGDLSEKEYEDFIETAIDYIQLEPSKRNYLKTSESTSSFQSQNSSYRTEAYDWSKHPDVTADDITPNDPESVQRLLRLNFTPRPYQLRMAQPGLRGKNSLVCLQTGAGKTFVSGIVAKYFYIKALKKLSDPSRSPPTTSKQEEAQRFKAVFLVPIKALVSQQHNAFQKVFMDESDSVLKMIENQAGERFKEISRHQDIFFMTVQKFANFVESKHADLSRFDLVVIDECHHCYDNHPLNSMMRQYHRLKLSGFKVPQIIALTASVGAGKKGAFAHLVHICANIDCFEVSAIQRGPEETELLSSTNTPLNDTILPVSKIAADPIVTKLKNEIMNMIATRLGYSIDTMDNQKLEAFLVTENLTACKKNDRDAIIGCEYLLNFHHFLVFYEDLPFQQCMNNLVESLQSSTASKPTQFDKFCRKQFEEFRAFVEQTNRTAPPVKAKLNKLVETILSLQTSNCRGLVLVRTKFHAVALEEYLNQRPELIQRKLIVGHLTGQGSSDDLCLPGTQQATVLKQFRDGTKSLLVATDVAQEGLDVAECSFVIRYEFVSNEIGTVQSRGRARAAQSKCFLITEASSINLQRENENRQKENQMKDAIDKLNEIGTREFQKLVHTEQDQLIKRLCENDDQKSLPTVGQRHQRTAKEIRCRYCDQFLCTGSSLRLQGSTVVCVDSNFEKLVNPPRTVGEKIVCPHPTCHKQLGNVILLSRDSPAYTLQITSLKFIFHDDIHTPSLFKKWSLYTGYVKPL